MKYDFIDEKMLNKYSLSFIFKTLNINKSSYYYYINTKSKNDNSKAFILSKIIYIYRESDGIYGAPKIANKLKNFNINISVSTTSRYMNILGIKSIVAKTFTKKKTTLKDEEKLLIVNLIKNIDITSINQVWTTDITYIKTINEGNFFLISFIDYYSKKVVSWGLFENQKTDKIIQVLDKAIKKRKPKPGLIIHSDKGAQMRSFEYREFLKKNNIIYSYTSLNHSCDENAAQESFHSLLKKEKIYLEKIYNFEDAYRIIFDYIEGFYNPRRIHSSIGYLSPNEFENKLNSSKTPS